MLGSSWVFTNIGCLLGRKCGKQLCKASALLCFNPQFCCPSQWQHCLLLYRNKHKLCAKTSKTHWLYFLELWTSRNTCLVLQKIADIKRISWSIFQLFHQFLAPSQSSIFSISPFTGAWQLWQVSVGICSYSRKLFLSPLGDFGATKKYPTLQLDWRPVARFLRRDGNAIL